MNQPSERGLLARRAGLVALGTFASRVLGLVRVSVMAALFPVQATDAFIIAFTIPNTLRMVLGEGAVSNAFIPVFTAVRTQDGEAAGTRFLARFTGVLGALLGFACLAGILAAPLFALGYAGGYLREPARFQLVLSLTRWLFPVLGLAGLAALATGVLNVLGRFAMPAFAPALQNVAMIAAPFALHGTLVGLGLDPIYSLAFGALVGGVLALAVQLPPLARARMLPAPENGFRDPDVRKALALMAPLVLSLGVYQLNIMLSRLFTSFLPEGSQSYLDYGARVIEIPQGMFALAVASAALPTLSRLHSEGKHEQLLALFRDSLRLTLFIALPASAALFALSEPVIAVLLGRGAFGAMHILETSRSLAIQGLGVLSVALVRVVVPMFAAHQDTRTPVLASAINLVTFLTVSVALLRALDHVAIALANGLAASVQLAVLLHRLRRHTGPLGLRPVLASGARIALASIAMAFAGHLLARNVAWTAPSSELMRVAQFAVIAGVSLAIFLAAALLLRVPELGQLGRSVQRRRTRPK